MPAINLIDPRSASQQMADQLTAQITNGDLAPGDKLPSTAELRREWGVSAETARSAVDFLRAAGLVIGRHGVGVFVADWQPTSVDIDAMPTEVVGLETSRPTEAATRALQIDYETPVVVVTAVDTNTDGRVVRHAITSYPQVIASAAGVSTDDTAAASAARLADALRGGNVEDTLQARAPTAAERAALDLPVGVPVLAVERTITDHNDLPLSYSCITHYGPLSRLVRQYRRSSD